jgi:hypothetical protein
LSRGRATWLQQSLSDLVAVLGAAEAEKKAELYAELGLGLTYQPNGRTVLVEADLSGVRKVRVGGATRTIRTQNGSCGGCSILVAQPKDEVVTRNRPSLTEGGRVRHECRALPRFVLATRRGRGGESMSLGIEGAEPCPRLRRRFPKREPSSYAMAERSPTRNGETPRVGRFSYFTDRPARGCSGPARQ